jgi:hypothetical protein
MAAKVKEFIIDNLVGGYNAYVNKTQVRDNESPDMINMDFVGESAIKTRQGFIKYTSSEIVSDHKPTGIFTYDTGASIEVVYSCNTSFYKGSGGTNISGITYTADLDTNACQVGDRLYIANGTDDLSYYDGTNTVTTGIASAPADPKFCVFWNKRLYTNDETNPDRVYFGGAMAADGTVANTGNFGSGSPSYGGYFGFGKGKKVTGFAKFGSAYLYVFLEDAIYRISPTSGTGTSSALDHTIELVTNSYGAVSHRSIDQVENDIFFLAHDGIYSLGEQPNYVSLRTKELSARVKTLIDSVSASDLKRAAAHYYKHRYYLSITTGSYNDRVLVYDTRYQSWTYWDGYKAGAWAVAKDGDDGLHLYFTSDDSSASYIYEAEQGTNDDGSAISWHFYTKCYNQDDFARAKIYQKGRVLFGNVYGVVDIDVVIDETEITKQMSVGESSTYSDGWGSLPMGTFPLGLDYNTPDGTTYEDLTNDHRFFDIDQQGNSIQLKFSGSTLDEACQIEQFQIKYLELPKEVEDSTKYIN